MYIMVSSILVSQSTIVYTRYFQASDDFTKAMISCWKVIQLAMTFIRKETYDRARKRRSDIARITVVLLRTLVLVLEN